MESKNLLWPSSGNMCDLYHPPFSPESKPCFASLKGVPQYSSNLKLGIHV